MTSLQEPGVVLSSPTPNHFRATMSLLPTTVTVVAGLDEHGHPAGLTVGTLTSVSLEPPMVSFCIKRDSVSWPRIRRGGRLGISVLSGEQWDVSRVFATSGGDKFEHVAWSLVNEAPVIDGAVVILTTELVGEHGAGDHVLLLCRVSSMGRGVSDDALLFCGGGYGVMG